MYQKFLKNVCFVKCLSKCQSGFRRGYNIQYCLLKMLEKWKSVVDKRKSFGVLLADLSKVFDFILHDLLLVKLHAYRFNFSGLKSIPSYLKNRKERTKIDSTWFLGRNTFWGILGPWLFNIFLCDLFLSMNEKDFVSCVDDNTPCYKQLY